MSNCDNFIESFGKIISQERFVKYFLNFQHMQTIFFKLSTEKPGSPAGKLRATKISQDSVTLDWLPPLDDGGSPLTAYIIEAKDSKSNDW